MRSEYLVHLSDQSDLAALELMLSPHDSLQRTKSLADLMARLGTRTWTGVVVELDPASEVTEALASALCARKPPVVLRADLRGSVPRLIARLAQTECRATVSLRRVDSLDQSLGRALEEGASADLPVLNALAANLKLGGRTPGQALGDLLPVATAVAIAGARRRPVSTLAIACGLSSRTLQWRLERRVGAPGHRLLGWSIAMHALWRMDVLGWLPKRAAIASGFTTSEALSNHIYRHIGGRPGRLIQESGFWQTLASPLNQRNAT